MNWSDELEAIQNMQDDGNYAQNEAVEQSAE